MKKILPLILLSLICVFIPAAMAAPSLEIALSPEPQFNQVWSNGTYQTNLTLQNFNLSQIDLTGYTGVPNQLIYEIVVTWSGKGGYDFGNKTTGYSYQPITHTISYSDSISSDSISFDLFLDQDFTEYEVQPYEKSKVTIDIRTYIQMSDGVKGPLVASKSQAWNIVDDPKVSYLEGKFSDMRGEILAATGVSKLNSLNREKYLSILENMNSNMIQGNYIAAQDIWKDYDDDERTNLLLALVRASDLQSDELDRLEDVETQLTIAERDLESLQDEYDVLETTYVALSNTYHKVNAELDAAKRNLSTAITAIFLSSILFYFIGQRGLIKRVQ
ncbi:hypothetical protein E2P71_06195 [Candidatus Bathyarchaeota archaeon]|nr:hypothetical protein E2P71_06195 [Candidatus Bathyarchaeota archaeon]